MKNTQKKSIEQKVAENINKPQRILHDGEGSLTGEEQAKQKTKIQPKRQIIIETDGSSYNIVKNETTGVYELMMIIGLIQNSFKQVR